MLNHRRRSGARLGACCLAETILFFAHGCGDSDTAVTTTTTRAPNAAAATLPDACGLVDDATVAKATGNAGTKSAPQAPTDVSARCEWKSGERTLSLLVRRGSTIASDFNNARAAGFNSTTLAGAEAAVSLGARETARDYRLVRYLALSSKYYVSVTVQGPDAADAPATEAAAGVARAVLAKLPT